MPTVKARAGPADRRASGAPGVEPASAERSEARDQRRRVSGVLRRSWKGASVSPGPGAIHGPPHGSRREVTVKSRQRRFDPIDATAPRPARRGRHARRSLRRPAPCLSALAQNQRGPDTRAEAGVPGPEKEEIAPLSSCPPPSPENNRRFRRALDLVSRMSAAGPPEAVAPPPRTGRKPVMLELEAPGGG